MTLLTNWITGTPHLAVQHVQPKVCYLGDGLVATLQRCPQEERLKNAGLEIFHQLQLSAPFDFKSLETSQLCKSVDVETPWYMTHL